MLLTLTSCWDRREIEERAVVLAISIDKATDEEVRAKEEISHLINEFPPPETGFIKLTAQIAVPGRIPLGPSEGGGASSPSMEPVWILSAIGYTVDDALVTLQQELADRLFYGHLRIIVISEEIAKDGLDNINDYFRRNPQIRRLTWLVVSEGMAADLINASPELERVPALYLLATMDHAVELGKFPNEFLGKFWTKISNLGSDGFLPYIKVKDEENIQLAGLAYFQGDKMIGKTNPIEIGVLMAIVGVPSGGYSVLTPYPDESHPVLFRTTHRQTNITTEIKNGRPEFTIDVALEGSIDEKLKEGIIQFDRQSTVQAFQEEVEQRAKKTYEKFIAKMQQEESDIFGFGEYIRAKHPSYWRQSVHSSDHWRSIFKDAKMNIQVTVKVRLVGMKAN